MLTSTVIFSTEHPRTSDWLLVSTSLRRQVPPFNALSKLESRRTTAPGLDLPMMSAVAEFASALCRSAALVGGAKENVDCTTAIVPAQSM
jgi:hypothetical protein